MGDNGKIPLSKVHGVNPGMGYCIWCGEEIGVILYGKLPGDAKAPYKAPIGLEPCDKCKSMMSAGITVTEISKEDIGTIQIQPGMFLTGRWIVIDRDAVKKIIMDNAVLESVLKVGMICVDKDTFSVLIGERSYEDAVKSIE